jgi:hypothetical protein
MLAGTAGRNLNRIQRRARNHGWHGANAPADVGGTRGARARRGTGWKLGGSTQVVQVLCVINSGRPS